MKSLLQTTLNTRDLGGYMTVNGNKTICDRIYRSDRQGCPSKDDIELLLSKGITTIIDMRTEQDISVKPSGFEKLEGFLYFNIPIKEGSKIPESVEAVPRSYMDIACSENMHKVFDTIAEANAGVMFNCSAGKDRSGVVTAILLMLCDVKEDEIVSDYMLTKECNKERFELIKKNYPDIDLNIVIPRESFMIDFIKLFGERFGDVKGYFSYIGLSESKVDKIREKLLSKPAETMLPDSISRMIDGKKYDLDDIGMSGAQIMIFDDSVLKIMNYRKENEETVQMMRWMKGKIPVPEVICYESDSKHQYLLMSKVTGKMSCDEYYLEHPQELLTLLAKALKMLWSVDISDCPRNRDIDAELKEAKYRIENHLVDLDNVEPTTFGEEGFKDPQALLEWLEENRPEYEPVLSHGDFCLPNIFLEDGKISGLIDLGDTGIGDKWRDIALCYRSLKHNFDGSFGGKVYPDFHPDMLFHALEMKPDWEKLKYYILLDELF